MLRSFPSLENRERKPFAPEQRHWLSQLNLFDHEQAWPHFSLPQQAIFDQNAQDTAQKKRGYGAEKSGELRADKPLPPNNQKDASFETSPHLA